MKRKFSVKLFTIVFLAAVLLCNTVPGYGRVITISELVLEMGKKADEALEQEDYNVLYCNLNKTGSSENNIYLGYKTGEDAITGLVVSDRLLESISYDGADYTPVSELNLNEGSDAAALYLYYTKDPAAGAAITRIEAKTQYAAGDEIFLDYTNDYKVVLTDLGERANLEEGKEDYVTYLLVTRTDDDATRPQRDMSYSSIDTSKGDLRDEEVASEKEYVDDSSELENEAKEEALREAEEEENRDAAVQKGILIGGIAVILSSAVLVFVFLKKKRGAEKNEK